MKRSLLLMTLISLISLPVAAELTVEDATSRDYLKNHGHSSPLTNAVQKEIASINGEPLTEPVEHEYYDSNRFVKFVRKVFMYIDPSLDDHSFLNDHDMKTSPSYTDL